MGFVHSLLRNLQKRSDLTLIIMLLAIIFMIILPLPTWLIDIFISCNIALVLLTLAVIFYLKSPSELSTLPTLLLFSTLFRLAISISTTRLILIQADAGEIIQAFGDFVVGGSVVIGIVVFLIITIVQFIVITKGSERVAEVSARFALDSLPGKQMSIDSDMRAGEIDLAEAKRRRAKLRIDNEFYGAMDGAMKFVKGDSIAGLIIIAVNLIGGVAVGVGQHGMAFGEAIQLYSVLTVGDGLVSQIPALIMAVGAGLAITRIANEENAEESDLGSDIVGQLSGGGKELSIAGGAMATFALVPGFPTLTFLSVAILLAGSGYLVTKRRKAEGVKIDSEEAAKKQSYGVHSSVRLEMAPDLSGAMDLSRLADLLQVGTTHLYSQIGIPFPTIALSSLHDGRTKNWALKIEGIEAIGGHFPAARINALAAAEDLTAAGIDFEEQDFRGETLKWVELTHIKGMQSYDLAYEMVEDLLNRIIIQEMPSHGEDLVGVEEAETLFKAAEQRYGTLVAAVRKVMPPEKMVQILRPLVAEKVPLTNLRAVLEAILEWAPRESDPATLAEFVRTALARQISNQYANESRMIPAFLLDPDTETTLRDSLMHNSLGSFMALTAEQSRALLTNVRKAIGDPADQEADPVFVTAMDIRPHFKKFLKNNGLDHPVLSQKEIYTSMELYPLGVISTS